VPAVRKAVPSRFVSLLPAPARGRSSSLAGEEQRWSGIRSVGELEKSDAVFNAAAGH